MKFQLPPAPERGRYAPPAEADARFARAIEEATVEELRNLAYYAAGALGALHSVIVQSCGITDPVSIERRISTGRSLLLGHLQRFHATAPEAP
jgi:hypothetical protein